MKEKKTRRKIYSDIRIQYAYYVYICRTVRAIHGTTGNSENGENGRAKFDGNARDREWPQGFCFRFAVNRFQYSSRCRGPTIELSVN